MRDFLFALYWDVMPIILQLIAAGLGTLLIWVANTAKARWGIEIEARHREALHSALMSGIRNALGGGLTGQAAINAAISYAARSVPDAIAKLDPEARVLEDLAYSKLQEAMEKLPILELGGNRMQPAADPA